MISIDQFHELKLSNLLPSYKDAESYDPSDWCFMKTWLGCYTYNDVSVGAISLNYGEATGNKLVALEMEHTASSSFKKNPERDAAMRKGACEMIGCSDTNTPKEEAIKNIEELGGIFVEVKSRNFKGGYSSLYTYHKGFLCDYILKDGIIVMVTVFDPALVLQNRTEEFKNSIEIIKEDLAEDEKGAEEYKQEIDEKTEELETLEKLDLSNFSHVLETIFVTPQEDDVIITNTNIEYKVWPEYEKPEDPTPAWIKELNEKDPDILFQFFMNSDMSIFDQLEEKQWEVDSFDELIAYKEELMSAPAYTKNVLQMENEMLGKKKKFSKKKLKKKFKSLLEYGFHAERPIKRKMDLKDLIKADSDDHVHILRCNVAVELRIDSTMQDWSTIQTVGDACDMLYNLNQHTDLQRKEPMPASAAKLQQDLLQITLQQSMEETQTMMAQAMKDLEMGIFNEV